MCSKKCSNQVELYTVLGQVDSTHSATVHTTEHKVLPLDFREQPLYGRFSFHPDIMSHIWNVDLFTLTLPTSTVPLRSFLLAHLVCSLYQFTLFTVTHFNTMLLCHYDGTEFCQLYRCKSCNNMSPCCLICHSRLCPLVYSKGLVTGEP